MNKEELFRSLKNKLIVSCQADEGDPFDKPEYVALFAKAAERGGAAAIRSQGIEKTGEILKSTSLPVIGLLKSKFPDGYVRITGSFREAEELVDLGCHMIAVDGTFRERENLTGPEFIREIKKRFDTVVMADVSVYAEGIACAENGADCISSTLSGYTPGTKDYPKDRPDTALVRELAAALKIPVIAEGRINTPARAAEMINLGAWSVVVGTAITRPRIITSWYADALSGIKA